MGRPGTSFELGRPLEPEYPNRFGIAVPCQRPLHRERRHAERMARVAPIAPVTSHSHDVLGECSAARPR